MAEGRYDLDGQFRGGDDVRCPVCAEYCNVEMLDLRRLRAVVVELLENPAPHVSAWDRLRAWVAITEGR